MSLTGMVKHNFVMSNATWPEYMEECGNDATLKNAMRANAIFSRKYEGNTITWEGYIVKITDYRRNWFRGDHAVVFLVKMEPTESEIHADLILSLEDEFVE
jgi:hypothetical protein